jgi:glyoxylase-like metal-dependent hydrolase (beta-lactamase superfamily II)
MNAALPATLDHPVSTPPAPGEVIEIAPRIRWLRMPLPFALDHINLWLLADDDGTTLVDCGFGDSPTRALWERHFATTLASSPIRRIVATHYHPDHLGNAAWLSQRFAGAPVAMTSSEYLTAHTVAEASGGHTMGATVELFRRHGMADADLAALESRGNRYRNGVPELPESFIRLHEGSTRRAGGVTWRVIEGFGHSPEHASLHSSERGVLIAGDMLLPKISTNVSVGPVEPDSDPLALFLRSLTAFEALPPDTLVLPSHGLPFRGIALRVAQLRAHHAARLAELEDAIKASTAPLTAAALVPVLFRRELDVHQRYFAMGEAIAHLNHLWHAARLERRALADGTLRFAASRL